MATKNPERDTRRFIAYTFTGESNLHTEFCAAKAECNCSIALIGLMRQNAAEGLGKDERGYVIDSKTGECNEWIRIGDSFKTQQYVRPETVRIA